MSDECVIYLQVPLDIRFNRVKQRAFDKFGDRVLVGGDMYEQEQEFFDFVVQKTMEKRMNGQNVYPVLLFMLTVQSQLMKQLDYF